MLILKAWRTLITRRLTPANIRQWSFFAKIISANRIISRKSSVISHSAPSIPSHHYFHCSKASPIIIVVRVNWRKSNTIVRIQVRWWLAGWPLLLLLLQFSVFGCVCVIITCAIAQTPSGCVRVCAYMCVCTSTNDYHVVAGAQQPLAPR